MFNEILLNRVIFVGVTFFVLVFGAQFYRWHVRHETTAAPARRASAIRRLENRIRIAEHIAEEVGVLTGITVFEISQMHLSNDDTRTMFEETEVLFLSETPQYLSMVEAFLRYKITAEALAAADSVSPFGFDPSSEMRPEYPNPNLSDYPETLHELKEKTHDDSQADERWHSDRGTHW